MPASRSTGGVGRIALETFLIVFAVVLGFAVSDWGENREREARADQALTRIEQELERNRAELDAAAEYYGLMAERMEARTSVAPDDPVWAELPQGWRGLSPPTIRTATFEVAIATGALERSDFRVTDDVAVTYEVLESLSGAVDGALSNLMSGTTVTNRDWSTVFGLLRELVHLAQTRTRHTLDVLESVPTD